MAIPSKKSGKEALTLKSDKTGLTTDATLLETDRERHSFSDSDSDNLTTGKTRLIQVSSKETGSESQVVEDVPFYHGYMGSEECTPYLRNTGDFLVRKVEDRLGNLQFVISVCASSPGDAANSNNIKHFVIKRTHKKGLVYVYTYAFASIPDLISYHCTKKKAISKAGLCIVKAIRKPNWQLNHEQIEKKEKLDEGVSGEVYLGLLNRGGFYPRIEVAIKQLREKGVSMDDRNRFLREANLMLKFDHPNVIKLYGVAAAKDPIMIIMELATGGTLLKRVQDATNAPNEREKVKLTAGVACGLAYLESQQVIHRDVAARNCLIGKDGEAKVCDFGLSLTRKTFKEKSLKCVPIRWLAPETLKHGSFSSKSDVWGYGVTMWEVFSNGKVPYEEVTDLKDIRSGVVSKTLKLAAPDEMPKDVKEIFELCMKYSPSERADFADIASKMTDCRTKRGSSLVRGLNKIFGTRS